MDRKPFLGQVPLVLGPSSWGATIPFASEAPLAAAAPMAYYSRVGFGNQWWTIGPFPSKEAALRAASNALSAIGAGPSIGAGFQIVDAAGRIIT